MFNSHFFKAYILPGITFQSIVISGGYCTGQEIVQYFLKSGPANGFYGLLLTTVVWSFICALCFVLAKAYHAYDYKTFFKILLGRGWVVFEACYLYMVIIALSVIAASVGSMLQQLLGIPYNVGLILPLIYIMVMVFKGSEHIAKMFSYLSIILYIVFVAFLMCCYEKSEINFLPESFAAPSGTGWIKNGIAYACYNLGCVPAILFTLRAFKTKREAVISGLLAGPFASIPGILLFMALLTEYPAVLNTTVPSTYMLEKLAIPLLTFSFSIVLISTLVETGVGLVHAFNERITRHRTNNITSPYWQYVAVGALLIIVYGLSQFGLVNLIVQGYGLLTWIMLGVFILPLLTRGIVKIRSSSSFLGA